MCGASPNLVLINVSPIEYGHVLLVPRVMDDLPQVRKGSLQGEFILCRLMSLTRRYS